MRFPGTSLRSRAGTDRDLAVDCQRCGVAFRPRLTDGACPVCGEVPVDVDPSLMPQPLDDETRVTAIIVVTMAANLVVLALLAAAFLGR